MLTRNIHYGTILMHVAAMTILLLMIVAPMAAQDEEGTTQDRPIRSTFSSVLLIEQHTVDVPFKKTFEFDIQHRFGTFENGFEDFIGLYAPSNIRLGLSYVPIENLMVGVGATKLNNYFDFWAKYAILRQTESNRMPLSLSYYGVMAIDAYDVDHTDELYNSSDRLSYFHQVIIARKFADWLSLQIAPSWSHFNIVQNGRKNDHFAISLGGRVGISPTVAIIFNVDQPLTSHDAPYNPGANVSLGVEIATSSHAFQIFMGTYRGIIPQENHMYNPHWEWSKDMKPAEIFSLGFNITRLWNF